MAPFRPWQIRHIDLSKEIPSLPGSPGVGGVYAVFWWKGIPAGERDIPAALLPMPASQVVDVALKAIAPAIGARLREVAYSAPLPERGARTPSRDHLTLRSLSVLHQPPERLWDCLNPEQGGGYADRTVSVVICTRNRPTELKRCLHMLAMMSTGPNEIVVVDNDPSSTSVKAVVSQFPGVCYVPEPRPGLSVARNTGIRRCTGDIIAFTDDDVEVHSDWILNIRKVFADPSIAAATGLILPAELETEAEYQFQHGLNRFGWGYCPLTYDARYFERTVSRGTPAWHIGAGANMAFRREVFGRLGGFDERLGAGASGCSEDSEMWYRMLAAGGTCRYDPRIVVYHYHRRSGIDLEEQTYQYMRGHVAALLIQFEKHRHWGNLYRAFGILPRYYARLAIRRLIRGVVPGVEMLGAQIRGCLAGVLYYVSNRHVEAYTLGGFHYNREN
jgi:GT2 family glycosyltransferase